MSSDPNLAACDGQISPEMIIGNWFATGEQRRERTVIATKVYGEMGDWPNDGKLSALNIRRPSHQSARPVYRRLRPGTHAPVLGVRRESQSIAVPLPFVRFPS